MQANITQINPKIMDKKSTIARGFVWVKLKTPWYIKNIKLTINNRKFIIPMLNRKFTKVFIKPILQQI